HYAPSMQVLQFTRRLLGLSLSQIEFRSETECAASSESARDAQLSTHAFHEPVADRQSETRAAVLACDRTIRLRELIENAVQLVRRDADSGVGYGEGDLSGEARFGILDRKQHFPRRGELHGIA